MLCEDVIYRSVDDVAAKCGNGDIDNEWCASHLEAFVWPDGVEKVLLNVIYFLASYADGYYRSRGSYISDNQVLGVCWFNILINMRGIFSGGTGRLNRRTLDRMLLDMAVSQGFDVSNIGSFV